MKRDCEALKWTEQERDELLNGLNRALFLLESPIAPPEFNAAGTVTELRKLADAFKEIEF